jgi:soluble lytic murein transglycosylase-like protein
MQRRRLGVVVFIAALAAIALLSLKPWADKAVQEFTLPLRHEDIIRQQANDKNLDPSLIAGVIYVESRFRDQTSHAGAKGLMQLMPATADYIAHKSGGTRFVQGDLATPQINIAYGSWYLRYLLDHYNGDTALALAAYNAGEGAVQRAGNKIPNYRETQNYVKTVLQLYAYLKPSAGAGRGNPPGRVRMELAAPRGGALGRGNMPSPSGAMPTLPDVAEAPQPPETDESAAPLKLSDRISKKP